MSQRRGGIIRYVRNEDWVVGINGEETNQSVEHLESGGNKGNSQMKS